MFISVSNNGDRYSFVIGDRPTDDPNTFFQSLYDFDLVDNLKSDYSSYAEAHSNGLRLIKHMPSSIMAKKAVFEENTDKDSPEERVVSHFGQQVSLIGSRIPDILSADEKERQEQAGSIIREMEEAEKSIQGVLKIVEEKTNSELLEDLLSSIKEMKSKVSQYVPAKPEAKPNSEDEEISVDDIPDSSDPALAPPPPPSIQASKDHSETLLAFGTAAAKSLIATHKTAHVRLVEKDDVTDSYFVHIADSNGDVCCMKFNNNVLLTSLIPSTRVAMVHPYHSSTFMERYWEPITMAVGHYLIANKDILISHSDENSSRRRFAGSNISDGTKHIVTISTENGSWWIKDSQESVIKTAATQAPSAIGTNVRCIRKNLPTYYGRTGMVVNVIPRADTCDVVVDFGRGLGTLVLENSEVQA
jgi:hypothetical protein